HKLGRRLRLDAIITSTTAGVVSSEPASKSDRAICPSSLWPQIVICVMSDLTSEKDPALSLAPPHLIHPHRLLEAFGHELAAVREQEPFAGAQPTHRISHQNLPTVRLGHDSRRQDHRRAEEVAGFLDRFAGV